MSFSQKIAFAVISILFSFTFVVAGGLCGIAAREAPETAVTAWKSHRESCIQLPEENYHRDHSRAVRGIVHGPEGKPVADGLVKCIRLTSLLQLAQSIPPAPALWSGLVETETRTDSEGRYEFPHLSEGCRTICVSASGLAADVQSLILVQDGSGARVDFHLEAPRTLRVRLEDADDHPRRIHLVPYRWWPELTYCDVTSGETEVDFSGIGGPFRKGLVFVSDLSSQSGWQLKAAFDLDRSDEITVSCTADYVASTRDVPEADCVLPWQPGMSEAGRLFFSMLTPVALFWQTDSSSPSAEFRDLLGLGSSSRRNEGSLRGYGPYPFQPVLIESRDGLAWLEWTSDAAEFELAGIPAGIYRVRSLSSFGQVSFARGLAVPSSGVVNLESRLVDQIQLDEPLSREVMGIVRWEDGRPVAEAEVFLQNASNFRLFLKRVVTNRNGFFTIPNVPGDADYFAFTLPPKTEHAMKSFVNRRLNSLPREAWLDLSLSPHRVIGQLAEVGSSKSVGLFREDSEGQKTLVWSVDLAAEGKFEITNVPRGRYVVHAIRNGDASGIASVPFDVNADTTVEVRWAQ